MIRIRGLSTALLGLTAASLISCCAGERTGFDIRYENGVPVRSYHTAVPPQINPWRLGEPLLFGADQSAATYLLARAGYIGESTGGTVIVLDIRSHAFHRFSPEGRWLGAFGGIGGGPGEFSRGGILGWVQGEEILVWDRMMHRLSFFDASGDFLTSHPINSLGSADYPVPYGSGGERRYLAVTQSGSIGPEQRTFHLRLRPLGDDLAPVAVLVDTLLATAVDRVGNRTVIPPFSRLGAAVAVAPDRPAVIWWPGEYRLDFLDAWTGERRATVLPARARPVTRTLREWRISYFIDDGLEVEARRNLTFPERLPHIGALTWGSDGRLWVMDYLPIPEEAVSYTYNVFAPDGEWLFRQSFAFQPRAFTAGGVWREAERDDGSPVLEYYPLVKAR